MPNYYDINKLREFLEDEDIADLLDNNDMSDLFAKWYKYIYRNDQWYISHSELKDLFRCLIDNDIDVFGNLDYVDSNISKCLFTDFSNINIDKIIFNNVKFGGKDKFQMLLNFNGLEEIEFNDCSFDTKIVNYIFCNASNANVKINDCKFTDDIIPTRFIQGPDALELSSSNITYKLAPLFYLTHEDKLSDWESDWSKLSIKKGTSIEAPKYIMDKLQREAKVI